MPSTSWLQLAAVDPPAVVMCVARCALPKTGLSPIGMPGQKPCVRRRVGSACTHGMGTAMCTVGFFIHARAFMLDIETPEDGSMQTWP